MAGRHIFGVDDVFYAERHAANQSTRGAAVNRAGVGQGLFFIQINPCVDLAFPFVNAFQTRGRYRLAGRLARLDLLGDLARRQLPQLSHTHHLRIAPGGSTA